MTAGSGRLAAGGAISEEERQSYGQILKSSALIGGSSMVTVAIGIVRTKVMAVLLGPSGYGLMGLFASISDLTQSVAGMGITSSGVRQIAEAVGTGEHERIARTVVVLRRMSVLLGLGGAAILLLFSRQVSAMTFGNDRHALGVALLSLAVCFSLVSGGQGALIQGMRRISDLARLAVLGGFIGTAISITTIYFLREEGVAPALVGIAATSAATSWWYGRKIRVARPVLTVAQIGRETAGLLKLGVVFMASGFLTMGAAYAVRTMVLRMVGFPAAGWYQSAWTVGGLYTGFILQAMGADFYPRLTGVAKDNRAVTRLVNEQARIGVLLAGPGVIATLTLAPLVIALFYSGRFDGAVGVLRWICLGMTLRVLTWPLGFVILAKGESRLFFLVDFCWAVVNIGLSWFFIRRFGLDGAGIAFFGSYVFYGFAVYVVARRLCDFRWTPGSRTTNLLLLILIAAVFCGLLVLPDVPAAVLGLAAVAISGFYSTRVLFTLVPSERLPRQLQRLMGWFGIRRTDAGSPS